MSIPGDSIDARKLKPGEPLRRPTSIAWASFPTFFYDRKPATGTHCPIVDQAADSWGEYATRVQRMRIPVNRHTGVVGIPVIDRTILFKDADGQPFNGLNPACSTTTRASSA